MKLRILSGTLKFKAINAPKTRLTRPATSRLRQVIFDSIRLRIEGARVLDLFAGSGMLAFESISLGASHATLVEIGSTAFKTIQNNAHIVGLKNQTTLKKMCGLQFLKKTNHTFDIIFLDPPYTFEPLTYNTMLTTIQQRALLNKNGIIILEVEEHCLKNLNTDILASFTLLKKKRLGSTMLLILA